jgi:hypothetical protein
VASKAMARAGVMDRCDLCGAGSDGTFSDRIRHLRKEHPAYARGLLLRVASPLVFLVTIVALQAVGAPVWSAIVAIAASLGLAALGITTARAARVQAGARSTAPLGKLVREGGLRFVLLAGVLGVMLILASNR